MHAITAQRFYCKKIICDSKYRSSTQTAAHIDSGTIKRHSGRVLEVGRGRHAVVFIPFGHRNPEPTSYVALMSESQLQTSEAATINI